MRDAQSFITLHLASSNHGNCPFIGRKKNGAQDPVQPFWPFTVKSAILVTYRRHHHTKSITWLLFSNNSKISLLNLPPVRRRSLAIFKLNFEW
ncbi:hypothetical protein TorRG33x02_181860 [Trema orientale]|uniref:Uncharacterized protein n=1 Tax=Trema orientale TaxID=63057 RepID=A0A2P5EKB5_TREOI|nr:hypothetical protein TorRG33x02_181860 [Trema orientale]